MMMVPAAAWACRRGRPSGSRQGAGDGPRDRVIAEAAPGVAAGEAFRGEPAAGKGAVAGHRLAGVVGAGRAVAAARRADRRDQQLVAEDTAEPGEAGGPPCDVSLAPRPVSPPPR